jgi:vitamin B12 transporter
MFVGRRAVAGWILALLGLELAAVPARSSAQEPGVKQVAYVLRLTPERVADVQAMPLMLRQPIMLQLEGATLERTLRTIATKAGLDLSYSRTVVPLSRVVSVDVRGGTVAEALRQALIGVPVELWISVSGKAALVPLDAEHVGPGLGTGTVVGRVTDAKTQTPLVGATIALEGTRHTATTGSDGRYRLADVAAGTYTVRARYIGYAPSTASVTVSAEQEATADFGLEKSVQRLDEVVTTGTVLPTEVKALPTPVTIISDSDIAAQRPHTFPEVFRQLVPGGVGWDLVVSPGATSVSVRGATNPTGGSGEMKIFIDGIESSNVSIGNIDPNSIARVEVIRGPQAAAIYGSDAIGGVMQIFTKRGDPSLSRPQFDGEASAGVVQTPYAGYGGVVRQGYRGSVSGGGPGVSYNFGAGYTHTPDWVQPVSAQSNASVYGGVHLTRGILSADVTGRQNIQGQPSNFNPDFTTAGFAYYSNSLNSDNSIRSQSVGARVTLAPTGWWSHTVTVGIDRTAYETRQTQPRLRFPGDTLFAAGDLVWMKTSIGYNTSIRGPLTRGTTGSLTIGFDHYSLPVEDWFTLSAPPASASTGDIGLAPVTRTITNNTGYFAQGQVAFHDALFVTAGIRAEQNTNFGDSLGAPVSPQVGLTYVRPVGQTTLKLRGSWGRAIRPPQPAQKFGNGLAPNARLEPERQQGWDAGVDLVFGTRGSLDLTYFDQTAENLIAAVLVSTTPALTDQFQNVGRVKNRGIEVEGSITAGVLQLKGQYGYVHSRILDLGPNYTGDQAIGEQPWYIPTHTAGASLGVTPVRGTTFTAGAAYIGSWFATDYLAFFRCLGGTGPCLAGPGLRPYTISYPSVFKLNATLSQQFTRFASGFVSVDNLADNTNVELDNFSPVIGRITTVGISFHY